MKITVIIPAAGQSKRFNAAQDGSSLVGQSKVERNLGGKPIFLRSIELFLNQPSVEGIVLAVSPGELDAFRLRWGDKLGFHGVELIAGGKLERWETVKLALEHLGANTTHVAVHDAARPLTPGAVIDRVFAAAERYDAVVPALAVAGTLKRVAAAADSGHQDDDAPADPLDAILGDAGKPRLNTRRVVETVSRENLVEVQTPQVFERKLLERAYAAIEVEEAQGTTLKKKMVSITDDASLIEALGEPVYTVEGDPVNFKITKPADLELASLIVNQQASQTATSLARKRLFADDDDD